MSGDGAKEMPIAAPVGVSAPPAPPAPPTERRVTWAPPELADGRRHEDARRCTSQWVQITGNNYGDIVPFINADVGNSVRVVVEATWRGEVCNAWLQHAQGGLEDIDDEEHLRAIDPRSAVRLIKEIEGFENDAMLHLSISATYALLSTPSSNSGGSSPGVIPRPPVPVQLSNDQFLLSRLDGYIDSSAFTAPTEAFAAQHAHKFKPLTADDEHPLHYQELYLQFEAVLEHSLEAFLREHGATVTQLVQAATRAKERGDQLRCIDVLLASSDYPAFLELMLDHKFNLYAEREITPDSVLAEVQVAVARDDSEQ